MVRGLLDATGHHCQLPTLPDVSSSSESLVDGILQNIDGEQLQPEAKNGEALLYCAGEAWMEDVEGGANRRKVGLMKLISVKRENLIYTVDTRPIASKMMKMTNEPNNIIISTISIRLCLILLDATFIVASYPMWVRFLCVNLDLPQSRFSLALRDPMALGTRLLMISHTLDNIVHNLGGI